MPYAHHPPLQAVETHLGSAPPGGRRKRLLGSEPEARHGFAQRVDADEFMGRRGRRLPECGMGLSA
jgi:hypothetical protein